MVSRLSIQLSRVSAAGPGTGDGGSPSRRRTWSPLWTTSSTVMVDDAAERLCVEQDDGGRDPSSEWQVVGRSGGGRAALPARVAGAVSLGGASPQAVRSTGNLAGHAPHPESPDGVAAAGRRDRLSLRAGAEPRQD